MSAVAQPCVCCGALTELRYKAFCRTSVGFWETIETKVRYLAWYLFAPHRPWCENCIARTKEKWWR